MKKILYYLLVFFRRPGVWTELAVAVIFAAGLLWFNAAHGSERVWLKSDPDPVSRLIKFLAMYGVAFGGPYLMSSLLTGKTDILRSYKLWLGILIAITLFSVRAWYYQYWDWITIHVPPAYYTLVAKYFANGVGVALLGLPLLLFWSIVDRKHMPLYGFHARGVDLKPYFGLLLLMVPLLLWAAQQPDFQATYPRAQKLELPAGEPKAALYTGIYELFYALDFITTEFFFRGFLILHFARFAGARAVLPMCVFYVVIHFDKPLAEAISSFFGGLILGILALETRSIYGGIIVHLGIALLMEGMGVLF